MELSIVIPALNESAALGRRLGALRALAGASEILVVDGGSTDRTVEIAAAVTGVEVLRSAPGRARQMNAGAAAARGDTLLFCHADVRLPPAAVAWIAAILERPGVVAGAFRTRHIAEGRWKGKRRAGLLRLADLRSRYSSLPYGDQGLFLAAATFRRLGGFADLPIMEDLEFSRRLRRLGTIATAAAEVEVSGRRFESAPLRQALMVNLFPLLYAAGVSPATLASLYAHPR